MNNSPSVSSTAQRSPSTSAKLAAEVAGTFLLVFGLIATATFAATLDGGAAGVGTLGACLSLGFAVIIGAYAFGPISGGHFNPAVTLGLAAAGRFAWKDTVPYIIAQLVGGIVATSLIYLLALGGPDGFAKAAIDSGFVSNGFGDQSPGGFGLGSAVIIEIVFTAVFVYVILGVTHSRAAAGFAPIAIGLTLTLMLMILIPIDNGSVNPARSIATAIYGGPDWLAQVWVFIVFPIIGGLIAGFSSRLIFDRETSR
ncbi:aquaporin Z [Leucobacter viscericola]|uniref:Aquaporin Z n=1 Tax=Leucobacter viscericola TaxID=2714935 RepID=A0A6G7XGY2_9MICO|nr:aquaporin [Leucobacter viscericola]QIK63864.1 aquaporin Z [Leucobacter viscericola]